MRYDGFRDLFMRTVIAMFWVKNQCSRNPGPPDFKFAENDFSALAMPTRDDRIDPQAFPAKRELE